jgi:AcrR family transcriptional regulator
LRRRSARPTAASSQTRRRRSSITTRRSIEAAAWQLSKAKGYQPTTVDETVEEVGSSQRTFFRYFDSKEAAVLFGDWRYDHH